MEILASICSIMVPGSGLTHLLLVFFLYLNVVHVAILAKSRFCLVILMPVSQANIEIKALQACIIPRQEIFLMYKDNAQIKGHNSDENLNAIVWI